MPARTGRDEVVIWHNPRCSKSREALALIREAGIEPRIVEYLKTPPGPAKLREIARMMGVHLRELLRTKEAAFKELELGRRDVGNDEILAAIAAHPVLIERPIVETPLGVCIGRPPQAVLEILPTAPASQNQRST